MRNHNITNYLTVSFMLTGIKTKFHTLLTNIAWQLGNGIKVRF